MSIEQYRICLALAGLLYVCEVIHYTVNAIVQKEVINGFETKWGFPQCVGAIDGSHIPVQAPLLNHTDYFNRKGWYSMLIQAVVDHRYLFRNINVGWPGSVHDARVFVNSALYEEATKRKILQGDSRQIVAKIFHHS